jgi:membrane-associated HD superfamily phosphohydrolase
VVLPENYRQSSVKHHWCLHMYCLGMIVYCTALCFIVLYCMYLHHKIISQKCIVLHCVLLYCIVVFSPTKLSIYLSLSLSLFLSLSLSLSLSLFFIYSSLTLPFFTQATTPKAKLFQMVNTFHLSALYKYYCPIHSTISNITISSTIQNCVLFCLFDWSLYYANIICYQRVVYDR